MDHLLASIESNTAVKQSLRALDLKINTKYRAINFKTVDTKFGKAIQVELEDCNVFLPKRFSNTLKDEDISALNENVNKLCIVVTEHIKCGGNLTPVIKIQNIW